VKVPHCKECGNCRKYCTIYAYLYCEAKSLQICVGESIKTSPSWCPLKEVEKDAT